MHLPGPWRPHFYVRQSYIRGTCCGCCRSCGRPRPRPSSSGRLASFLLTTSGSCARSAVHGCFLTGLCCLNTDPSRWPLPLCCCAASLDQPRHSAQPTSFLGLATYPAFPAKVLRTEFRPTTNGGSPAEPLAVE